MVPSYLIVELFVHSPRIQTKSSLEKDDLTEVFADFLGRVEVVNEDMIAIGSWAQAIRLCAGADRDDKAFVALALERNALLWTRDNVLRLHLERNGFTDFSDPLEVIRIADQ